MTSIKSLEQASQSELEHFHSKKPAHRAATCAQAKNDPQDTRREAGNLAVQRLLRAGVLQAKLAVSQPGDSFEQEADRMAEAVVAATAPPALQRKCDCAGGPPCAQCGEASQETVQRQTAPVLNRSCGNPAHSADAAVPDGFLQQLGTGAPLPSSVRIFFESRLGYDFSRVRVHTDQRASESARAVNALAYTVGRDIVFGAEQYAPGTHEGRKLLAHELAHTLQQTGRQNAAQASAPPASGSAHTGAGTVSNAQPHLQRRCRSQGDENFYRTAPNYCRDTGFSGIFHSGQCYREVPVRSSYFDCPPGDQVCFDDKGCHDSYDLVSTVESKNADGSCNLHGYCFMGHAGADIAPGLVGIDSAGTVDLLSCYARCAQMPGMAKFWCLQSCH